MNNNSNRYLASRFLCEDTSAERSLFSRLSDRAHQRLAMLREDHRDQGSKRRVAEATYRILQEDQASERGQKGLATGGLGDQGDAAALEILRGLVELERRFAMWLKDPEFTAMLEEADVAPHRSVAPLFCFFSDLLGLLSAF